MAIDGIIKKIPAGYLRPFKNKLTLFLYRCLVLRPPIVNSVISGITIGLTGRCNLTCSYCPKSMGIGVKGTDMDFDLFKKIVEEACNLVSIRQIVLVGFGEPLMYSRLIDAIKYIKGRNHLITVTTTTNGILLEKGMAYGLIDAGLDEITISVNATSREKYLTINRSDAYERVVANTATLLGVAKDTASKMRINIQVMKGLNTDEEIENFRSFWKPKLTKYSNIQLQPFINWGGLLEKKEAKRPTITEHYPCAHIQNSWIITPDGKALACCMVFPGDEGDLYLGNVNEKSLRDLYLEGKILDLRQRNVDGTLYDLSPCKNCDAYTTLTNLWIKNPFYPAIGKKWI